MKRFGTGVLLTSAVTMALLSAAPYSQTFAAAAVNKPAAAPVKAAPAVQVLKSVINVNGKDTSFSTISLNGTTLVSVRELALAVDAKLTWNDKSKMVEFSKDGMVASFNGASSKLLVNGQPMNMAIAPRTINGAMFVDAASIVKSLGGEVSKDASGKKLQLSLVKLLDGSNESARWVNGISLLVAHATDETKQDYIINTSNKKYEPAVEGEVLFADMVVSPDGKSAVALNEAGEVFIADLASKTVKKVSEDKSIKSELQWSNDGSKLYFLQGDKTAVIAEISIADGKITPLVDDKVNYKSDLQVTADGKKFVYVVSKDGKLTADSVKEDDQASVDNAKVTLDLAGTEPQIFVFDPTVKDAKAVQVTKGTDNKVFTKLLQDSRIVYVSADTEKENQPPVLKSVSLDGKETKDLITDLSVLQSTVIDGHVYVLAADASGKKAVYTVDAATGSKQKKWDVPENTQLVSLSADGKQLAVSLSTENGESLAVLTDQGFRAVTK
ncbi:stalk domain-containing protein [Brevibacillus ginsengisoli]|uniref:stalk domain-containing protein n=1 Tax=Brevibacillus ginsengisoli TaxID=363854 RepID=UPI003CE727AA